MTSRQRVLQFYPLAKLERLQLNQYMIVIEKGKFIGDVTKTSKKAWKVADNEIDEIMLAKLEW